MPIPLREVALVVLFVPAALALEVACWHADIQWAVFVASQAYVPSGNSAGSLFTPSDATEESMLIGWDVQIKMRAQSGAREAVPPGEPVAYDRPSL